MGIRIGDLQFKGVGLGSGLLLLLLAMLLGTP